MKPHAPLIRYFFATALIISAVPAALSDTTVPRIQTLENGLTIVILEDHSSPLVATAVWVHTGGKDESEQLAGFSHYLEHLIPMGTEKGAPRQQQLEIFRVGGISSIQTNYDRTSFFAEVGTAQQDLALQALHQQTALASLSELGVSYIRPQLTQELKEVYDDPGQVLFLEQMRAAFPGQPYRFPYFGNFSTLATLEHSSAESFYRNFYVPNNMVVAVGGDINPSKTISRIRELFGEMKASKTLPDKPKFEPAFTGPHNVVKNLARMQPSVSILFPTPGFRHPDRFALAVLARLLDDPATSPLRREVLDPAHGVLSVSSQFHLLEERGLLAFTSFPALAGRAPGTASRMLAALKAVRGTGLPENEVAQMSRQMRLAAAIRRDAVGAKIQDLAEGVLFGDARYGWEMEAGFGGVTAADVKRVAMTYLAANNAKTLIILPKEEKSPTSDERDGIAKSVADLDAGVDSAPVPDFTATLYVPQKGAPFTPRMESRSAPAATRVELPNGLVVLVKPERGRGIVAASLEIRAGSAFDPDGKEGLGQMVASALTLGTKSISGTEFRRRVGAIGSTFGISTFRESVEAGLTVFPEDLPEALSLLAGPMREPAFPEDQMEAVRDRIRRFGEAMSADPEETARALVREKVYRGHPYGRTPSGTECFPLQGRARGHRGFPPPLLPSEPRRPGDRGGRDPGGSPPAGRFRFRILGRTSRGRESSGPAGGGHAGRRVRGVFTGRGGTPLGRGPRVPGGAASRSRFSLRSRALGGLLSARGTLDLVLGQQLARSVTAVPEGLSRGGILYVEARTPAAETSRVAYEIPPPGPGPWGQGSDPGHGGGPGSHRKGEAAEGKGGAVHAGEQSGVLRAARHRILGLRSGENAASGPLPQDAEGRGRPVSGCHAAGPGHGRSRRPLAAPVFAAATPALESETDFLDLDPALHRFAHVVDRQRSGGHRSHRLHLHARGPPRRGPGRDHHRAAAGLQPESDDHAFERHGVAQRNPIRGPLRRLDAGDPRHTQNISLLDPILPYKPKGFRPEADPSFRFRLPEGRGLAAHVHHLGFAGSIHVAEAPCALSHAVLPGGAVGGEPPASWLPRSLRGC